MARGAGRWLVGAILLAVPAGAARAQPAKAPAPAPMPKQIVALPPTEWNWEMNDPHPLLHQGASDLSALTGGIAFGMRAELVNGLLPDPTAGLGWTDLPIVKDFTQDVRYFWIKLAGARELSGGISTCSGANSYIVFLFRERALFRISYRFLPDAACTDVAPAAEAVFARYLAIGREVALTVHYRNGRADVVDITDPGAGELLNRRWLSRGQ